MATLVYPDIVKVPPELGEIFSAILAAVNNIDSENLAAGAVTELAYAMQSIPTSAYQLTSITAGILGANSVATVNYQDQSVTGAKIALDTILSENMKDTANFAEWKLVKWTGNGAATRKIENIMDTPNFVMVLAQYTSSVRVMTGYDAGGFSKTMSSSIYDDTKFVGWTATGFEVKIAYNATPKVYVALVGKMNTEDVP